MKKNINTEELSFTHGMPDESLDKGANTEAEALRRICRVKKQKIRERKRQ